MHKNIFKNILDFDYKRNLKEAIGFYLSFSLFTILFSLVLGMFVLELFRLFHIYNSLSAELLGRLLGTIVLFILGGLLLTKRGRYKNFFYIILFLLAVLLMIIGGGVFISLLLLSYLSTK